MREEQSNILKDRVENFDYYTLHVVREVSVLIKTCHKVVHPVCDHYNKEPIF